MRKLFLIIFLLPLLSIAQELKVPASYSNIHYDDSGKLYYLKDGQKLYEAELEPTWTIQQLLGNPKGTKDGVVFDFGAFEGKLTYGLIPYGKAPHPLPVFRDTKTIEGGKVDIDIKKKFSYPYDFVDWEENNYLTVGYRVRDNSGLIIFDGEVSLTYSPEGFKKATTIYDGPYVSNVTENSAVIWFETDRPVVASLTVNGNTFVDDAPKKHHEWKVKDLKSLQKYEYTVKYGELSQSYHFHTAPEKGSREPFVFAYASDSRHATGGGERKVYGANAYIMKKLAAVAYQNKAAFVQFSGDMIDGYLGNKEQQMLQYYNWKKSIEPFWHYMPWYISMGNHEALGHVFKDEEDKTHAFVDKFPFDEFSAEAAFSEAFVNPENGPESEDGATYDPNSKTKDFPSYNENVFYYTHGNVAMVVLNSNYWFAPYMKKGVVETSGGLHGYIMDQQLKWLEKTITKLEKDKDIDHVFVTQHTPAFPNGGHSGDDMWYSGNNEHRPYVNGKPLKKGIIERRDEYLDILINKSSKVVGILTGDEHNYNWLKLTDEVKIHPTGYEHEKLKVSRSIYQINNGAAGAPYYGQEKLPWSEHTQSFSVENAICLFFIDGESIIMKVINPDTLNEIDEVKLK